LDRLKFKNPAAPVVKRDAKEDWEKELEMTDQKPWRLEDLVFESMGDDLREIATIDGVEIVRQNGRYWISAPYAQWANLTDREVDPALNVLFDKRQGKQ
jgi:hypothetical protein